MKTGAIVSGVVATLALIGVVTVFSMNASPYGTFADAEKNGNDQMHVAGSLNQNSIVQNFSNGTMQFEMTDMAGQRCNVVYDGPPPSNMGEAKQVVAVGGFQNGVFHSNRLLVKCPSKYEGDTKAVPSS